MAYAQDTIQHRLADFRRKYFRNQIVQGALLVALFAVSYFLLFAVAEGLLYLSPEVKTTAFVVWVLGSVAVLGWKVAWPSYQLSRVDKYLTPVETARYLGRHFPEISDKLLNLLQLQHASTADSDLIQAAIAQKEADIRPVPFAVAIDVATVRRLGKYLVVPVAVLALLFMVAPGFMRQGSERFLAFQTKFVPPPPYAVTVDGHQPELISGDSYDITIRLSGRDIPNELFIYIKRQDAAQFVAYPLVKKNAVTFQYTFKGVTQSFSYYIGNELHGSSVYRTEVSYRPSVQQFYAVVQPPLYTGLPQEQMPVGVGDFRVLPGSVVTWHLQLAGLPSQVWLQQGDKRVACVPAPKGFTVSQSVVAPFRYRILAKNSKGISNEDILSYQIDVVPDKSPSIVLREPYPEMKVSGVGMFVLHADVADDFGFSKAVLHYRAFDQKQGASAKASYQQVQLQLDRTLAVQSIVQQIDLQQLKVVEGQFVELYVEVWDNDVVYGPKSATSALVKIRYSSLDDMYSEKEELAEASKEQLQEKLTQSEALLKQLEQLKRKLIEKNTLGYEDKQQLKNMAQEQNQLLNQLNDIKDLLNQEKNLSKENSLLTEETLEKKEKLEEMLKQMQDPETKKLLEELEKRADDLNKLEMKLKLEQLQQKSENLKEDLQRTLDLLKQMEKEEKVQELVNKLEQLQAEQKNLRDETNTLNKDNKEELGQKQNALQQELQKLDKDLEKLEQLTDSPQEKQAVQDAKQDKNEAQQQMQQAKEQLQQNKKSQSQQSQKSAEQQMQEMSDKLSQMATDSEMQQQQEDYKLLRYLLENLLTLSFDQEDLRDKVKSLQPNDPQAVAMLRAQQKIADDMVIISDSLKALSSRNFMINKFVTDELAEIELRLNRSNTYMGERRFPNAAVEQHNTMSSLNKLANMLVESLNQMQQQMQQMKGKGKACMNPKSSGGDGMKKISQEQQRLNEKMQQMMDQKGKGEGKGKEMQDLAKQQEELRKRLKESLEKMNQEGEGGMGDMDKVQKDMQETEEELKRMELTAETLMRQQRILSRMLDFDKSMRERELDEKRKGTSAQDKEKKAPAALTEPEIKDRLRKELYNSKQYQYSRLYKSLIEDYFNIMER